MLDICLELARANNPQLDENQFYEAMDGQSIAAASAAFMDALADFIPDPAIKILVSQSRVKQKTIETKMQDLAMQAVETTTQTFLETTPNPGK